MSCVRCTVLTDFNLRRGYASLAWLASSVWTFLRSALLEVVVNDTGTFYVEGIRRYDAESDGKRCQGTRVEASMTDRAVDDVPRSRKSCTCQFEIDMDVDICLSVRHSWSAKRRQQGLLSSPAAWLLLSDSKADLRLIVLSLVASERVWKNGVPAWRVVSSAPSHSILRSRRPFVKLICRLERWLVSRPGHRRQQRIHFGKHQLGGLGLLDFGANPSIFVILVGDGGSQP